MSIKGIDGHLTVDAPGTHMILTDLITRKPQANSLVSVKTNSQRILGLAKGQSDLSSYSTCLQLQNNNLNYKPHQVLVLWSCAPQLVVQY